MSERKPSRLALIGLIAVTVIGSAAFYLSRSVETNASEALDKAKASQKLQSLTELNDKAPNHRKLDVQTWNATENEPLLQVNAELGFKPDREWREYDADVIDLLRRLK